LIPIGSAALSRLDRGQDINAAIPKSLHDGVFAGILVHVEANFAHGASP
jgi:hypothetical protein